MLSLRTTYYLDWVRTGACCRESAEWILQLAFGVVCSFHILGIVMQSKDDAIDTEGFPYLDKHSAPLYTLLCSQEANPYISICDTSLKPQG